MSQPLVFWMACVSSPDPVPLDPAVASALDRAIDDRDELDRLGFLTSVLPIPGDIAADPLAGVPQQAYAGRGNVIGHLAAGTGPSLLLNGHIDVVPAEAALWSAPPFQPV